MLNSLFSRIAAAATVLAALLPAGCSETVVAPDPTPHALKVYAGEEIVTVDSPIFFRWRYEPVYLGEVDRTTEFDLGGADSVKVLTLTMNKNVERVLMDQPRAIRGEVWIDAIRDLQTGKYFGADSDGTVHGFYNVSLFEVYDVLDTTTNMVSANQSIDNLAGPPDGRYVLMRVYDTSFIAITRFDGSISDEPLLRNGPGADVRIYARTVPENLQLTPRERLAGSVKRIERRAPTAGNGG